MSIAITSDSLSPMLIKELRQGVKSKAFYFAFLLMQGLMVFCVLMYVAALQSANDAAAFNGLFWSCLGATLILITPIRAMGALQQEIKGNTLELIFLTKLSAWRIVAGKWLALFSQSLLLTAGTLPYLLLRYFLGGIDIAQDLSTLFWLLMASAALTALGVCFSSFRSTLFRVFVIIVALLSPNLIAGVYIASRVGGVGGSSYGFITHPVQASLLFATYIALGVILCLIWGASRIAPAAENHSRWKRLITLGMILMLPVVVKVTGEESTVMAGLFAIIPMCCDALGEQPRLFPSVYRAFARRGVLGRIAGLFFYPGWPAAVFFTLLICGAFAGIFFALDTTASDHARGIVASLPGALLFPLALILLIRPKVKSIMPAYLGIQITCIILTLVALSLYAAFSKSHDEHLLMPLSIIPTCAFILHISQQDDASWMAITGVITLASIIVLFIRARPVLVEMRKLERASMAETPPPVASVEGGADRKNFQ